MRTVVRRFRGTIYKDTETKHVAHSVEAALHTQGNPALVVLQHAEACWHNIHKFRWVRSSAPELERTPFVPLLSSSNYSGAGTA